MSGKTNETLRRQWNILRLIPQEPRSITVNAICGALLEKHEKIERRNVERDLRSLLGTFDLQVDESEKPYLWSWRKDANFRFKPRLSDAESIALLLAQAHLSTLLPPQVQNDLRPWFQMAHRELSGGLWKENHQRTAVVPSSMPLQAPVLDDVVLQDVHQA